MKRTNSRDDVTSKRTRKRTKGPREEWQAGMDIHEPTRQKECRYGREHGWAIGRRANPWARPT